MKNWHTEKLVIDDTVADFNMTVPVTELMRLFEIATFNHSNIMGLDHVSMEKKSHAFWVVTKMKVLLKNPIKTGEKVKVTTWTRELGTARALRDCEIKSNKTVKAKFLAEWCCLDYETRKLRRMNTICYPELEMEKTNNVNTTFTNINEEVTEKDFVYSRVVRSSDIDVNLHTNNLKYNYMAVDAFGVSELKKFEIKEYEIYFINESYEGDKINIFKKKIRNGFLIVGKTEEKTIFRSVFKIKKKES